MPVASPCIRVCSIDETGLCIGCGRSRHEIAAWPRMSDEEKADVVERLAVRPPAVTRTAAHAMDCATCGACSGRGA